MFQSQNKKVKINYSIHDRTSGSEHLILIHDNGQSSKLFDSELRFYSSYFRTVAVDLTGHGKSGEVEDYESNFWADNAEKIIELCGKLKITRTVIIGTGGGAIVALNIALIKNQMIKKVIADSFTGLQAGEDYMNSLINYREMIKNSDEKKKYQIMNGAKWEKILDSDTAMQKDFIEKRENLPVYCHVDGRTCL